MSWLGALRRYLRMILALNNYFPEPLCETNNLATLCSLSLGVSPLAPLPPPGSVVVHDVNDDPSAQYKGATVVTTVQPFLCLDLAKSSARFRAA